MPGQEKYHAMSYKNNNSLNAVTTTKYIIVLFVETPRKFITAKLSIRKPGSSSVLITQNRYQTRRDTSMCFG
jgi:hypothetical protein